MTAAVSQTGMKGFLTWLKQDQPAIYAATAPTIAKAAPRGFSGANASALTNLRLAQGRRSMLMRGNRLSGCCGLQSVSTCCGTPAPVGVNICTSCAANSGTTCASTLTGVANIVGTVASTVLSAQQQAQYNNLVQTQLSRAQAGLSPLQLSSSAAGVPTISGSSLGLSSGTGTLLLIGGGLALLWALL
jgi:hypothetical protein